MLSPVERKSTDSKAPVGDDFDQWMKDAAASKNIWSSLPEEALAELNKVIEHNDSNPNNRIPASAVLTRLRNKWGVRLGHTSLTRYCRNVLGRRGWQDK